MKKKTISIILIFVFMWQQVCWSAPHGYSSLRPMALEERRSTETESSVKHFELLRLKPPEQWPLRVEFNAKQAEMIASQPTLHWAALPVPMKGTLRMPIVQIEDPSTNPDLAQLLNSIGGNTVQTFLNSHHPSMHEACKRCIMRLALISETDSLDLFEYYPQRQPHKAVLAINKELLAIARENPALAEGLIKGAIYRGFCYEAGEHIPVSSMSREADLVLSQMGDRDTAAEPAIDTLTRHLASPYIFARILHSRIKRGSEPALLGMRQPGQYAVADWRGDRFIRTWRLTPVQDLPWGVSATEAIRSQVLYVNAPEPSDSELVNAAEYGLCCKRPGGTSLRWAIVKTLLMADAWLQERGVMGDYQRFVSAARSQTVPPLFNADEPLFAGVNFQAFDADLRKIIDAADRQFSNPDERAPHLSGGAIDLEIWDMRTGKPVPMKPWEAEERLRVDNENDVPPADRYWWRIAKTILGSYKPLEDALVKPDFKPGEEGPTPQWFQEILANRRFRKALLTLPIEEGGILPRERVLIPNPSEAHHFASGDTASGVFTGTMEAWFPFVPPDYIAELNLTSTPALRQKTEEFIRAVGEGERILFEFGVPMPPFPAQINGADYQSWRTARAKFSETVNDLLANLPVNSGGLGRYGKQHDALTRAVKTLLENAFDAVASTYEVHPAGGFLEKYRGAVAVSFGIDGLGNFVITVTDNGMGSMAAGPERKKLVFDSGRNIYFGSAGKQLDMLRNQLLPDIGPGARLDESISEKPHGRTWFALRVPIRDLTLKAEGSYKNMAPLRAAPQEMFYAVPAATGNIITEESLGAAPHGVREALRYFNNEVLSAEEITWGHIATLYSLLNQEGAEPQGIHELRAGTLAGIDVTKTEFLEKEPLLRDLLTELERGVIGLANASIKSGADTAMTRGEQVARISGCIYAYMLSPSFFSLIQKNRGFDSPLGRRPMYSAEASARCAWFLTNYFLRKNGFAQIDFAYLRKILSNGHTPAELAKLLIADEKIHGFYPRIPYAAVSQAGQMQGAKISLTQI
ncbi:MAG: hypothetical protein NTV07_05995 [Candidatus Omnitrophica bacterium]|nr:hypothetical protein [Candidatus Omnitrophota bacterium]